MNTRAQNDVRNLVSGKDGQIYVTGSDHISRYLGEIEQFQAQMAVTNASYQPLGSMQQMAYTTGIKITITFTEAVIRDDIMLAPIYEDIANGYLPTWDIRGQITRRDGQVEQQTFTDCVPDGNIDLLQITAGDIIKRPWSFVCNGTPNLLSSFN